MNRKELKGVGVALVTPFKTDGTVDYEALVKLVDRQIAGGTDFLCVLGTTAETPTLTKEEQYKIRETVIERNAGRLPILLGCGGNCTQHVIDTLADDKMEGVDAILSVVPYYNKPSQLGMYEHFSAIAASTDMPIVLYNVPGRTGVNMLPDTTLRLANEYDNIVAVKEASGKLDQIEYIIQHKPAGFKVFSGDDGLTLPIVRCGGDGVISVAVNALPEMFNTMVHSAQQGDISKATTIDSALREYYHLLFADGNPAGVKAALHIQGWVENCLRLPLVPASEETTEQMRRLLSTLQ